eukprot:3346173-Pyramimonas_sp.AAC.1
MLESVSVRTPTGCRVHPCRVTGATSSAPQNQTQLPKHFISMRLTLSCASFAIGSCASIPSLLLKSTFKLSRRWRRLSCASFTAFFHALVSTSTA